MVRVEYFCEICGDNYYSKKKAVECESKGEKKQVYPIGMIFQMNPEGMVFVIAKYYKSNHHAGYSCWGFRDTEVGDNAPSNLEEVKNPKGTCGFDHWDSKKDIEGIREPDESLPCFKRAKKTMERFAIKPVSYKKGIKLRDTKHRSKKQ